MATKGRAKKTGWLTIVIIVIVVGLILWFTPVTDPRQLEVTQEGSIEYLELLALPANDGNLTVHPGFTLSYAEEFEQPWWVAYVLTPAEAIVKVTDRQDNFREDPSIPTGSAQLSDYRGSGYDRGHMAPFADLSWSEESASASFYLSNMSPQAGALNRGRWGDLESIVRSFSLAGPVCIVTGPVLTDGPYKTIGKNEVAVPNFYFKAVLFYNGADSRAIGFVLPNEACPNPVQSYAVSIDYIEELTGLDLFPLLPDDIESSVEGSFDVSLWDFSPYSEKLAVSYGYDPNTISLSDSVSVPVYREPETLKEQIDFLLFRYFAPLKIEVLHGLPKS